MTITLITQDPSVTTDDLSAHLRLNDTSEAQQLEKFLAAAQARAEDLCGRSFARNKWRVTETLTAELRTLLCPDWVSFTIESCTLNGQPWSAYTITGTGVAATSAEDMGEVVLTYVSDIPSPVRMWVLALASAVYANRELASNDPPASLEFVDALLSPFRHWGSK